MLRTICDGGINWNWYLQAEFNAEDKTCYIYFYDRWHKYDHAKHPVAESSKYQAGLEILEDSNRKVYCIKLNDTEYLVTNPDNIFKYKDFSKMIMGE